MSVSLMSGSKRTFLILYDVSCLNSSLPMRILGSMPGGINMWSEILTQYPILTSWVFWVVLGLIVYNFKSKIPFLKALSRNQLLLGVVVLGVISTGVLSSVPLSQMSGGSSVQIVSIEDSTAFSSDTDCNISAVADRQDMTRISCSDADMNSTAAGATGDCPLIDAGIFTITRADATNPGQVKVWVESPDFKSPSDSTDTVSYNLVRKSSNGKLQAYIDVGGAAADSNDVQQETVHGFAEGVTQETLGLVIYGSELAADELNQYDTKLITFHAGNAKYYFEYVELDAAA